MFTYCLIAGITMVSFSCNQLQKIETAKQSDSASGSNGVIKLDVRDSKADWGLFIRKKAPEG